MIDNPGMCLISFKVRFCMSVCHYLMGTVDRPCPKSGLEDTKAMFMQDSFHSKLVPW